MIQVDATAVTILLGLTLAVGILALLLISRISSRLHRIEIQLRQNVGKDFSEAEEELPSVAATSRGGAFEAFLEEEPARKEMTKAEQFSAYRKWRQEKGMNWSNS